MALPHTIQVYFDLRIHLLFKYLLFGWNPTGWYAVAIVLHAIASLLSFCVALATNVYALAAAGSLILWQVSPIMT